MQYLIGIDVGTSGTKSVLFDLDGNIVASATGEYPLSQPQNGWAEQDPNHWWKAVCDSLRELSAKAEGEIVGIGLSGQMHSLVLLDKENRVIRPAILWCDQRTGAQCKKIEQLVGRERLIDITANPALPGFTASKLLWVQEHEPQNYAKVARILLAKDYIRFMLTGEYATEVSDASGMQLLHVSRRSWSKEVCEKLNVDLACLGTVYESTDITGYVTEVAAKLTGLPVGVPVAGGGGDNAAAAIGMGVHAPGNAFTTIGTSGVVFTPTNVPIIDKKGRIHTFCAAVPGTWHVMGVTQAAGLSLNWFRKTLAPELSYRQIDEACRSVPIGADRLLYLPYLMGERSPVLDSDARGVFFGLSAIHTRSHMARAVLEGISYSLYSCMDVIREVGIEICDMALCGGGGKSPFWKQMLCDIYGIPVKTMASEEGAALGAAILGGCAAGVFSSVAEGCDRMVRSGSVSTPNEENHNVYMDYYGLYDQLYPALKVPFRAMAQKGGRV